MQHGAPPRPGDTLGRFLLQRELGRGRSGVVFLAVDTLVRQSVALKVLALARRDGAIERVHREVHAARRVTHKGLRPVFEVHETDGRVLVAMQPIEGAPLKQLLSRTVRAAPAQVLPWIHGVADALAAAHRAGLVHGALTSSDVLIRADRTPCVLGIGDTSAANAVARGVAINPAEDVRAVTSLLVETMTGSPLPEPGQPPPLLSALRKDAPAALDDVVRRGTASADPRAFKDIGELASALAVILEGLGVKVARDAAREVPRPLPLPVTGASGATPPAPAAPGHRVETAPTRLREELPPDATLPLSDLPPLVAAAALPSIPQRAANGGANDSGDGVADDSASWVVGGRAVDLPARPKAMQVVTESSTEPVHREKKTRRTGTRTLALAATLVVVGAVAGALAWREHQRGATAAGDAGADVASDAGTLAAPQDASTPSLAPADDAGSAGDAGAAVAAADAGAIGAESDVQAAATRALADKGLLRGDDVEVDRLMDRIAHPADLEDARDALTALTARLAQLSIDKKLVAKKLGRLRVDARSITPPARRRALEKVLDEAAALLAAERAIDANAKLNEAFASEPGAD